MLPRFQHLLVPTDFTERNQPALDIAFEIATLNRARTTLLHVIETIDHTTDDELREFYERLEQRADTELEALAQRFETANLPVDRKIRYGRRTAEIVSYAAEHAIDLIVMKSHPPDPARPMESLNTISYQVSLICSCPILLVK